MKKWIFLCWAILGMGSASFCQSPRQFNYQAIARDGSGNILANKSVSLRISILDNSQNGNLLYSETFSVNTNQFGLFSIAIGSGTVVTGNFSSISWGTGNKYLQTEIDFSGGSNFVNLGSSQLLSVPFALYANNSGDFNNTWRFNNNNIINANTGNVGIGTNNPLSKLHVDFGSLLVTGWDPINLPSNPTSNAPGNGTGSRHFFYLDKSAFRTGGIDDGSYAHSVFWVAPQGTHFWDRDSIGAFSFGAGYNVLASGFGAAALGSGNRAVGDLSFASGSNNNVLGPTSGAIGSNLLVLNGPGFAAGESDTVANFWSSSLGLKNSSRGEASITAGISNKAIGDHSVSLGEFNVTNGSASFAAGSSNFVNSFHSAILGYNNTIDVSGKNSVVVGINSSLSGERSFSAGSNNLVIGDISETIGSFNSVSGSENLALGTFNTVDGQSNISLGTLATATGSHSIAIGYNVNTQWHNGTVMIGDGSNGNETGAGDDNQFIARFAGGYYLLTMADDGSPRTGVRLFPFDNAWSSISDSTRKTRFLKLDGESILTKLAKFKNLGTWTYKGQDPKKFRHYGPMAQDFYANFGNDGIGNIGNDSTINSADMSGVLFIATQGLAERTEKMRNQSSQLTTQIDYLSSENEKLKRKIQELQNTYGKENEAFCKKLSSLESQLNEFAQLVKLKGSGELAASHQENK